MKTLPANCPIWLEQKILEKGGLISFYEFMNTVLNDPIHGYYGSGKANIGFKGDFVTSPSLSDDFSSLLSKQIENWAEEILNSIKTNKKLTVLEFGSGEGTLIKGIIRYFLNQNEEILQRLSFKILEINRGMQSKQTNLLKDYLDQGIDIKWIGFKDLEDNNFDGIVLAHEVLDAFPVERIQYSKGILYQQVVGLNQDKKLFLKKTILPEELRKRIDLLKNKLSFTIPPPKTPEDWTNELHVDTYPWLKNVHKNLRNGILLVIDYSLEFKRYYSPNKIDGNIVSYNKQKVYNDILQDPGNSDLTTHLCNEILVLDAEMAGFRFNGMVKQGEALLSLGLAEMLFDLQSKYKNDISEALLKREALLRLVDPICLGDFKWFVFQKSSNKDIEFKSKILIN